MWHIHLFPYCWFFPFLPYITKIAVLTKHISALVRNCKSIFSMREYLQLIWSTSSTYLMSCLNICSGIQSLTVSYSVAFVPSFVNRCQFPIYCVVLCGSRPLSTFLIVFWKRYLVPLPKDICLSLDTQINYHILRW